MNKPATARDIMVTDLVTVRPDDHVYDGIRLLLRHSITGAPVVDPDGRYLGMLSEKCCLGVLTTTARLAREAGATPNQPRTGDFMVSKLVTFRPTDDAFQAIGNLLRHRISGGPVVEDDREFVGVFSEKFSMQALLALAYDQLPSANVGSFMNVDRGRLIDPDRKLLQVAQMFLDTPYRRLPVLENGKLVGQVSRRDVLRAEHHLAGELRRREAKLLESTGSLAISDGDDTTPDRLESPEIREFMDRTARTIHEDLGLLDIARIFLDTNFRRLPVLTEDGKLMGQVSRRDVLAATHRLLTTSETPHKALLYLSAVTDPGEVPASVQKGTSGQLGSGPRSS